MRVGSLVLATDQGLGYLAKAFVKHGIVTHPKIIVHAHRETHYEWFPRAEYPVHQQQLHNPRGRQILQDFCKSMDVVLFFETPWDWSLLDFCRREGVKTVLMPMYECMPREIPLEPDLWLCPSLLDLQYYLDRPKAIFLPVPVEVPWRQRKQALTFVHNAGHGGLRGRNGTAELYTALQYVQSPITLIMRGQSRIDQHLPTYSTTVKIGNVTVDWRFGTIPQEDLYAEGDVFVFPEKFNGLSLPLQEAYASGMLVIAVDRFPINTWLPPTPCVVPDRYTRACVSGRCNEFDEAVVSPAAIAEKIDEWYGRDITVESEWARGWAQKNSWAVLGPKYRQVLQELVGHD